MLVIRLSDAARYSERGATVALATPKTHAPSVSGRTIKWSLSSWSGSLLNWLELRGLLLVLSDTYMFSASLFEGVILHLRIRTRNHHHHHHHHHSKLDKAPLTGAQRRRTDIKCTEI